MGNKTKSWHQTDPLVDPLAAEDIGALAEAHTEAAALTEVYSETAGETVVEPDIAAHTAAVAWLAEQHCTGYKAVSPSAF